MIKSVILACILILALSLAVRKSREAFRARTRARRAWKAIRGTETPLTEIALDSGFFDQASNLRAEGHDQHLQVTFGLELRPAARHNPGEM
jgi:hypothetical protein